MRLLDDVASRVIDPHLRRALELARRGSGMTAPNPCVGCVIVRDGEVVGEGYHPRAGEPHAEVFALAQAGAQARGATAYVSLEPCSHHGKTPPCTDALIAAGVARVVIGMPDPNPQAAGGATVLRAAGIAVEFADDPSAFEQLNEGWIKRVRTGMPFVTAKIALSMDARVSLTAGVPARMTHHGGEVVTRRLRSQADAVLVGAATVIADDPELTVRDEFGVRAEHQPLRVVLARRTLPGADARVFADACAPTLLLVPTHMLESAHGAALPSRVLIEGYDDATGLQGAWRALAARGIGEVLVEPGPTLLTALWSEQGALDAVVSVVAGGMAGPQAPGLYAGRPDECGEELVHRFVPREAGIVGEVVVSVWRPRAAEIRH